MIDMNNFYLWKNFNNLIAMKTIKSITSFTYRMLFRKKFFENFVAVLKGFRNLSLRFRAVLWLQKTNLSLLFDIPVNMYMYIFMSVCINLKQIHMHTHIVFSCTHTHYKRLQDIYNIHMWSKSWKMELNACKCKILVIEKCEQAKLEKQNQMI